ncbi:MAG: hypothetical protein AAGI48_14730 [Verrucomicrobiota bacterium]
MKLDDPRRRRSFRPAWRFFALIPIWHFIMHLCRAGQLRDVRAQELINVWSQAVPSLLLGISFLCLLGALAPAGSGDSD